jgi:hypothetical protein
LEGGWAWTRSYRGDGVNPGGGSERRKGFRPEIGEEYGLVMWGRRGRWIETRRSGKEIAEIGWNRRG